MQYLPFTAEIDTQHRISVKKPEAFIVTGKIVQTNVFILYIGSVFDECLETVS